MFDLEKKIGDWRQQMLAAGLKTGEALDELEDHLRNDIQQQIQAGLTAEQAFEVAVERIGGTQALKTEFAKIRRRTGFLGMLKGFLLGARAPFIGFTPEAQQSLDLARAEAPRLNHDFIGTEHVLLGLLNSESDIVSKVMRRLGIESNVVRAEIEKVIGLGVPAKRVAAEIPFTPRATRAFALAVKEAEMLHQKQVNSEHIFLGLIRENGGVAGLVLRNLGVDIKRAREEIVKEMNLRKGAG
jgi:Clp amino terminal domain, pathogenicity island component